jgi:hypothetical protein
LYLSIHDLFLYIIVILVDFVHIIHGLSCSKNVLAQGSVVWHLPEVSRLIIVVDACFYVALADLDMLRGSYRVLADEWVQREERLKLEEASEFWIVYTGCFRGLDLTKIYTPGVLLFGPGGHQGTGHRGHLELW